MPMERRADAGWIWLLIMAATLGCIWQQSTLPPASSSEVSGGVLALLSPLFGGSDGVIGAFLSRYIRKIAHFTEYAILGLEGEAFLAGRRSVAATAASVAFGALAGAVDETIQIFTGRGPSFFDVLIDLSGYVSAILAVRAIVALIAWKDQKRKDSAARAADEGSNV